MKLKFYTLLGICFFLVSSLDAQQTIEFRINGVATNVDDEDGWGAGDSDPQWEFEIIDNYGISDNDNYELSETNCAGTRTYSNTFFTQAYDCELPTSFDFIFRGLEDDPIGSDANSGFRTFSFNTSTLNTSGPTGWQDVFGGSGWVQVRASGDACGGTVLNTPVLTQGSGSVRYQIRLQYRVSGTPADLCKDECNDPYVLPTTAQFNCSGSQTVTPVGLTINAREPADASESLIPTTGIGGGSCDVEGSRPEDIWIRTTIADSTGGVLLTFTNNGGCDGFGCETKIAYAWYTSSNGTCSGLEFRGCDETSCFFGCSNGQIQVDGRPGEDVWIRVWEAPGGTNPFGDGDQGFSITINNVRPTAPADRCYTALPLGPLGCNYQATSPDAGTYAEPDASNWTAGAHPGGICQDGDGNPSTNTIWNSNENMVWYTFSHPGGPFNVAVDNMNCVGGAATAQLGVFSNSGTAQNPSCDLGAETGYGCSVGVGQVQLSIPVLPAGDYILVVDGNAGAQCTWEFYETIGGNLLPVQLVSFDAIFNETSKMVDLYWESTEEENFAGFTIERSTDAVEFYPVDFVPAKGTAPGDLNHYSYQDNGYPRIDVVYYRLRLDDLDGSFRYTHVKAVSPNLEAVGVSVLYDLYPNPVVNTLFVPFQTVKEDEVHAVIYDMSGKVVKEIVQGQQYLPGYHILEADVADLPQGIYVLRFTAGVISEMQRFVKY